MGPGSGRSWMPQHAQSIGDVAALMQLQGPQACGQQRGRRNGSRARPVGRRPADVKGLVGPADEHQPRELRQLGDLQRPPEGAAISVSSHSVAGSAGACQMQDRVSGPCTHVVHMR